MIEKSCWNTVVSMIFRGRRPSLSEIKCLKELFYKTYVAYMNTKDIDFSRFNYTISKLQNTEEELARLEEFYPTPQTVNVVEVQTMEEEFFFDDDYLKKVPEENLQDNDSIKKLVKIKNVLEKKANEFINLKLAENEYYSNLINLIGYGRIISLFRMYFMNKKIINLSDLEMRFFKIAIPFLSETLACVQRSDSPEESKEFYSYLCFNCNTVGCHDRTPMRQKIASDEFQACSEMSTWFDRNGIVPQTPEIQFKCGSFEITIQVELENQTRKQSITKKTDLNWRTFIESGSKRSEVYRKYLDNFNYLTNYMTEEKMISKYYDKYDDLMTNYYATIKSYELVKDIVNLGNKSYVFNNIETVTLADLNISFEINDESYSSVSLVKKEEYLESKRKSFFSGNIKFVRTS